MDRVEQLNYLIEGSYIYAVDKGINPAIEEWINERDSLVTDRINCNHEFEAIEAVDDKFDPALDDHSQQVELVNQCIKCDFISY